MLKVLVPVDGSSNCLHAVRHVINEYQHRNKLELHLLNVQPRLARHVARFLSRSDRDGWHKAQAQSALVDAKAALERAGVPFQTHWVVGQHAAEICHHATKLGVHHIVMGTARSNSITRMLQDSTTNQVLEATSVPVEVVAGDAVSTWERWGLPLGVLGGLGSLATLAFD